jgi:hypothetical protein
MATNDCNKTKPCGCEDQPYASLPPCNPIGCPDPIVCSEINNAQCIIYTGEDIVCQQDVVVAQDTNVADALNNIVDYFCQEISVDQNIWATFAATTGSTTANTTTDTLTVVGTNGITTSILGDTLTITGSGENSQFTYEIGQYVPDAGGVIAYRWLSSTPGGTPQLGTVQNYIVVDTNDMPTHAPWSSIDFNIPNVGSTYNGTLNTNNLIAAGAALGITAGVAAELCEVSLNNGQGDWYLPAIDELSKIFQNRWEIAQGITVAVGTQFGYLKYWSSTQEDVINPTATAYTYSFTIGGISTEGKSAFFGVRAVRRIYI